MKFENSEIFLKNSGGGLTLESWSCSWGTRDVSEELTLASSSLMLHNASLWAVTRSLYSVIVGLSTLVEGSE